MGNSVEVRFYDQDGLAGDELRELIVRDTVPMGWIPIDLDEILRMHHEAGASLGLAEYIATVPKSPNEKALILYLDSLRQGSHETILLYARYIVGFMNSCRKQFLRANYLDIRDYLAGFSENGRAASTLNLILASLKGFFRMMHNSGVVTANPAALIKMAKIHRSERVAATIKKAVPHKEVVAQRQYLKEKEPLRNLVMVTVMATMGLRAIEICKLCWKDYFDSEGKRVFFIQGKGKKLRVLAVPAATDYLLRKYLEFEYLVISDQIPTAIQELPIFPILYNKNNPLTRQAVYRIVDRMCERAGLPHRSPHAFRHYFISTCVQHGESLSKIQRAAGHGSLETTNIYIEAGEIFSGSTLTFNDPKLVSDVTLDGNL